MGLLDRAISLSSSQQAGEGAVVEPLAPCTEDSPEQRPRDIVNAFQEHIGFTSASIMLLDFKEGEYYSLVSTGPIFNTLGEPRIRSNLPVFHIDGSDQITISKLEALIPNLTGSNPEEEVMVLRIGTGNPPSAVLLATGYQLGGDRSLKPEIQQLVNRLKDEIERHRQIGEKERETTFSRRLTDAGIGKATAVFLNMSDAIKAISESYPEIDTHKAAQKVNNLLGRITGRMGKLYSLEGERVLIISPYERLPDHELYLHQLSASFRFAYKELKRDLDFQAEFKLWPNDRTYIEKQLPS